MDGPWWTEDALRFTSFDSGHHVKLPMPINAIPPGRPAKGPSWSVQDISRDGHRVLLQHDSGRRHAAFDLRTGKAITSASASMEPSLQVCGNLSTGMFAYIRGVGVYSGRLGIVSRKGAVHLLLANHDGISLLASPLQLGPPTTELKPVGTKRRPRWQGETNSIRVVMDSRGLLHLADLNGSLPEIAVVLNSGRTAMWAADGTLCGPPHLVGGRACTSASHLAELLTRYAERLT